MAHHDPVLDDRSHLEPNASNLDLRTPEIHDFSDFTGMTCRAAGWLLSALVVVALLIVGRVLSSPGEPLMRSAAVIAVGGSR